MPPTTSAASAPPRSGEARADGERDREDAVDVDPESVGDAGVVDRRPQLRAEASPDQEDLQQRRR